mmetsp:Transcript_11937/g.21981  ORF Transcript_11937/g.21981 Transcript_11937/m.21981 type:complete len:845 (-) Transcript_11937:6589-9123(-)|eukprot:CAMPEP_0203783838 /NCGR_PEP_ID=MMETSP0100_2-20121128/136_1 /ASSEMBLY_ACC=CAM_ASM_000210 /TAXON_ID=96639 /ORGANISM=" , Strain NY0313808BC1" /LENGTH=844 /DNA_ID=CAMNT_0050685759 /DNA_START=59 /DNA_END=2593 /DNA_ORIENTATION=-
MGADQSDRLVDHLGVASELVDNGGHDGGIGEVDTEDAEVCCQLEQKGTGQVGKENGTMREDKGTNTETVEPEEEASIEQLTTLALSLHELRLRHNWSVGLNRDLALLILECEKEIDRKRGVVVEDKEPIKKKRTYVAILLAIMLVVIVLYVVKCYVYIWVDWAVGTWGMLEIPTLCFTLLCASKLFTCLADGESFAGGDSGENRRKMIGTLGTFVIYFRLLFGFPLTPCLIHVLATWVGSQRFGFWATFLFCVCLSFAQHKRVLKLFIPAFAVYTLWLFGGWFIFEILCFPISLLVKSIDIFFVEVFKAALFQGAGAWLRVRIGMEDQNEECDSLDELKSLVVSFSGAFKLVVGIFIYWFLYQINAPSLAVYFWKANQLAMEALQDQNAVLEYAKNHPFHAKLHRDPREFFTDGDTAAETDSQPEFSASISETEDFSVQLDQRAKLSTSIERIESLRESLKTFHGVPGRLGQVFQGVTIEIDRESSRGAFNQLADRLLAFSVKTLKNGIRVKFKGEDGIDAGGLKGELFSMVVDELSQSIISSSSSGETPKLFRALQDSTLMLATSEKLNPVHYYALGRMVGFAILSNTIFRLPLSSALLKMMTDVEIDNTDVKVLDPTYFKNRMGTLLQPGGVGLMKTIMDMDEIPFVWVTSEGDLGQELCPDGSNMLLCEDNKYEYIQLLSEEYICGSVREGLQIFLSGFHEVVPVKLLQENAIDYIDLALTLGGIPTIDVADWKNNTIMPEKDDDGLVEWFWECVSDMEPEQQARLLQFATGFSRPPVGGFSKLQPRKFNIVIDENQDHLPSAITCFNTLRIPNISSKEGLEDRFRMVLSQRYLSETFGEK